MFKDVLFALLSGALSLGSTSPQTPPVAPAVVKVDLADRGGQVSTLESPSGRLTLRVPAHGVARPGRDDRQVFDGPDSASVAVESLKDEGLRALVLIDGRSAPERFAFEVGGDVAVLELEEDGGVSALDDSGTVVAVSAPPWARDADGRAVPTHYEVEGTRLIQVVEHHRGTWAYGIVADPSFWSVLKCVAAITWVIGTTVFVAGKILKVKATIRALGGIKDTAGLLLRASSWSEKMEVLGAVTPGAAAYFLGISTIKEHC